MSKGIWAIFINEVNPSTLNKGTFIPPEVMEKATGFQRDSDEYGLQCMRVRSMLEAHFEEKGAPVTIKHEQGGLRILTDEEATEYNHQRFKQTMRGMFEANRRMSNVDESNMRPDQLSAHRNRVNAQAHVITAVAARNKELRLIPYSRSLKP